MTALNVRYFDDMRACQAKCHEHSFAFYEAEPTLKDQNLSYSDMQHTHSLLACHSVPKELPYARLRKEGILQSA